MESGSDADSGLGIVDMEETEEPPRAAEAREEQPSVEPPRTKQELSILKAAIRIIERRQDSVSYRELLYEVYADLLDRDVEFESVRQIEATLLKQVGRELVLLDGMDDATGLIVKKWWVGDKRVEDEEGPPPNAWKRLSSKAKPNLPKVRQFLKKRRHQEEPGYRPKKHLDEDD